MSNRDFARSMARLSIAHWRQCKRDRLPRTAAESRNAALWWLAQARRFPK